MISLASAPGAPNRDVRERVFIPGKGKQGVVLRRIVLALAVASLLLAPTAQAASKPVAYFFIDPDDATAAPDPGPLPVPLPIGVPTVIITGEGILDPYDPKLGNFPNGTQPHTRLVTVPGDLVDPLQFVTPEGHEHPDRMRGYVLLGLWTGQSAMLHANLTATLYEVPEAGEPIALLEASTAVNLNTSEIPNATAFIPPNSTDPLVILFYELGLLLPLVLQPPSYFLLGPVDINLTSNASRIAVGIHLDPGSSPAPLPIGAASSIQYDSIYSPTFMILPWYTPDPPKATTTKSATGTTTGSRSTSATGGPGGSGSQDDDAGSNDTPGLPAATLAALLALAALVARRRLR